MTKQGKYMMRRDPMGTEQTMLKMKEIMGHQDWERHEAERGY